MCPGARAFSTLAILLASACASTEDHPDVGSPPVDASPADASPADASPADQASEAIDEGVDAGDDVADGSTDPGVLGCMRICATLAQLDCPVKIDCLSPCVKELDGRCKNSQRRLVACAMQEGPSAYHCGPDGYALIDPDVCVDQMAAIQQCNRSGLDPP